MPKPTTKTAKLEDGYNQNASQQKLQKICMLSDLLHAEKKEKIKTSSYCLRLS